MTFLADTVSGDRVSRAMRCLEHIDTLAAQPLPVRPSVVAMAYGPIEEWDAAAVSQLSLWRLAVHRVESENVARLIVLLMAVRDLRATDEGVAVAAAGELARLVGRAFPRVVGIIQRLHDGSLPNDIGDIRRLAALACQDLGHLPAEWREAELRGPEKAEGRPKGGRW